MEVFLEGFENRSAECNWGMFASKVHELIDRYVPMRTISSYSKAHWYTLYIKRLCNRKKWFFRSAKHSPSETRWDAYKKANNAYISALKTARNNFLQITLPTTLSNDPKKFWRIINPDRDSETVLLDPSGKKISLTDCPTVLNEVFCHNFVKSSCATFSDLQCFNFVTMNPIIIQPLGVEKIIESLKVPVSQRIDLINAKFLKSTKVYSRVILSKIFQQSIDESILPPV